IDDLRFEAWVCAHVKLPRFRTILEVRMLDDFLPHLEAQIESAKIRVADLDPIHRAQALRVVIEAAVRCHQLVEHFLAGVAERGMAEVVRQSYRLRKFLVETQCPRYRARNLRGFKGMSQPSAVVIALVIDKDLGFVFEASKRSRMDNAVAVARKDSANPMFGLGKTAPATGPRRHRIRRNVRASISSSSCLVRSIAPLFSGCVQHPKCYHAI